MGGKTKQQRTKNNTKVWAIIIILVNLILVGVNQSVWSKSKYVHACNGWVCACVHAFATNFPLILYIFFVLLSIHTLNWIVFICIVLRLLFCHSCYLRSMCMHMCSHRAVADQLNCWHHQQYQPLALQMLHSSVLCQPCWRIFQLRTVQAIWIHRLIPTTSWFFVK